MYALNENIAVFNDYFKKIEEMSIIKNVKKRLLKSSLVILL
jgi:hypothetical protein